MRRAAKKDGNQTEIVQAIHAAGWYVTLTFRLGQGVPDLVASKHGLNVWVECKMPGETLTPAELQWWLNCPGEKIIAFGGQDAVDKLRAILGIYLK